ncbi:MAG: ParB/RepB/Spo0J family partition protein [Desulfobacterales bacterium]
MDSKSSDNQNVFKDVPLDPAIALQTVMLADVDSADTTFRITTRTELDNLVLSIQKLGLMHAPVLKYDPPGYIIVCGFRRIAACRNLGWTRIPARVLRKNFDFFEMARLAVADNALQRPLNLIETSRALKLLTVVNTAKESLVAAAAELGLPLSPAIVPKLKRICDLPRQIQKGILTNVIDLSMALELDRFNPADGQALLGLFEHLKLGLNRQRELLLLLEEISQREEIPIQQLMTQKPLNQLLENTKIDRSIKRQKVRTCLRRRRFPMISKAETQYKAFVKQLKLGPNINLMPPKDFEGMTYTMTIRFDNQKELKNLKEKLEKIIHHPGLGKILDGSS